MIDTFKVYQQIPVKGVYRVEDIHDTIAFHTEVYGVPTEIRLGRELPEVAGTIADHRFAKGLVYLGL